MGGGVGAGVGGASVDAAPAATVARSAAGSVGSGGTSATVVVGAETAVPDAEILKTLTEMSPDHRPTKVDVGDGGYLQASPGFAELRANAGAVQVEVNIITPMDDSIDLGPLATKVANQVVDDLS